MEAKSLLVILRPRWISPVTGFVFPADNNPFRVPAQICSHDRRAVAQSQPRAPSARLIGFGSMQEQVAVDGNLSGSQLVIYWLAKLLSARNRLVQNICLVVFTQRVGQMAQVVRTRNEAHACVFNRGV